MKVFEAFLSCGSICTDTRSIVPGSVFFALKGVSFNGNTFALQALEAGAAFAVVDENVGDDERLIKVSDVLTALQGCALDYRRHLDIPTIGLTGSNGKTTTKELFLAVLKTKYKVHATKGNFNNHIGVPLTILSAPKETEMLIVEMGANHQKEIGQLASIAEPTLGYITNYGKAHLEGFGGVEGIIKGKSELYDYIAQNEEGVALVNADDAIQLEKSAACRRTTFGKTNAQFTYTVEEKDEFAGIQFSIATASYNIQSNLSGSFNCTNLAAAVALGRYCDVPAPAIVQALTDYLPAMNRVEWRKTASNQVLLDAYNANPTSMSLSIENFAKWHKDGWLVLGDMFELGEESAAEHRAIVKLVQRINMEERCILVGKHFGRTSWRGKQFPTTGDLKTYWKENGAPKDAAILLKGSRGIALEQLLPLL
ncbi:MAG: UDP-N-acetylmuramoyl-tripeptide--D-alanyl-D-alanine ligase [Schleiferiaceae bacterium]|jgi:UDP-N-acetylmuramoyl-tripeptide--D-alanyl-D-alanine ligase|nr:UDP-N-acetylmuramoyl-tripeptide--D-alanyl-D-alanine ligase [Schleiferiaceae bacterium]MDG1313600.1 UDP-N-acetylmuramoyl-tripeptide--D-alanyl-D-alanine ligase [Schleiferiaceae bacterium]MDG1918529.1 UDP-N-acetylmuramoyl-tripeptide--D-alanyl-D-alanine ligase [Schleiferiaceae bacterium]